MDKIIPRRCHIDMSVPAELAIREAVDKVERMGADVRLTRAVVLLGEARDLVSDYVDSHIDSYQNVRPRA
jgi:hypothetical protein